MAKISLSLSLKHFLFTTVLPTGGLVAITTYTVESTWLHSLELLHISFYSLHLTMAQANFLPPIPLGVFVVFWASIIRTASISRRGQRKLERLTGQFRPISTEQKTWTCFRNGWFLSFFTITDSDGNWEHPVRECWYATPPSHTFDSAYYIFSMRVQVNCLWQQIVSRQHPEELRN